MCEQTNGHINQKYDNTTITYPLQKARCYTFEIGTQLAPFCRRHFQNHFPDLKASLQFVPSGTNGNKSTLGVVMACTFISWTNANQEVKNITRPQMNLMHLWKKSMEAVEKRTICSPMLRVYKTSKDTSRTIVPINVFQLAFLWVAWLRFKLLIIVPFFRYGTTNIKSPWSDCRVLRDYDRS